MSKSRSGFTIVELLIAIVVIAILAAISMVAYQGIQKRAAEATIQSDLRQAKTYMEQENIYTGSYPADTTTIPKSPDTSYELSLTAAGYCLSATSSAADASPYHISKESGIAAGPCQGHTYGGPAPADVNIAPPLDQWTLSGDATYDPATKEILLGSIGSTATSPYIRVDAPQLSSIGVEMYSPVKAGETTGERLYGVRYYDENHNSYVLNNGYSSNGSAVAVAANSWEYSIWNISATGPDFMYLQYSVSVGSTYGVAGTRIRNPSVTLTR